MVTDNQPVLESAKESAVVRTTKSSVKAIHKDYFSIKFNLIYNLVIKFY